MIKYTYKNNFHYIVIEQEIFKLSRNNIHILKEISFQFNEWVCFLKLLNNKNLTLLEIAETIFGEKRCQKLEKVVWALLEIALQKDSKLVQVYLEYHAHICFSQYWIHRYAYFEYHGFDMGRRGFLRCKIDKGVVSFDQYIDDVIKNGFTDNSLPLRVISNGAYARLNYQNQGWYNITLDFRYSFNLHKNIHMTLKMIDSIQRALRENGTLKSIAKEFNIGTSTPMMYAFAILPKEMFAFIKKSFRKQLLNNHEISLSKVLQIHIEQENNFLKKLRFYDENIYQKLIQLSSKYQQIQIRLSNIFNKIVTTKFATQYHLGYIKNNKWQSFDLNLEILAKDMVSSDLKTYALYIAANDKNKRIVQIATEFFKYIKFTSKTNNLDIKHIKEKDIANWLNHIINVKSVRAHKNAISSFYKFMSNQKVINHCTDFEEIRTIYKKIARTFSIEGNMAQKPTLPLPEEVFLQISLHLDELLPEIKNAFLIMSATGCRPSELAYITPTSLIYDKKLDCYILNIFLNKQKTAYAKKGVKSIRKVPIYSEDVVNGFYRQVTLSDHIRKESNNNSIFIRKTYNRAHQVKFHIPSSKEFIREINSLIEKYDIKADLDDKLWNYTPYQMRSMLATAMVEKGHAPEEIKAFFGWLTTHTPERAYAFIREKKIEELNTDLFKKHFRISLDENYLNAYTYSEKEQLFVELYIHRRKMEYGDCVRHPIMGECGKLQTPDSCASCARLITDLPYLNTWTKFRDNQQIIFDALINALENEGISKDEYTTWAEYTIQKHRLDAYKSIVDTLLSVQKAKNGGSC